MNRQLGNVSPYNSSQQQQIQSLGGNNIGEMEQITVQPTQSPRFETAYHLQHIKEKTK